MIVLNPIKLVAVVAASILLSQPAFATTQYVTGKVLFTQGHINPACRQVGVQDSSGVQYTFRLALPSSGPDSIMAVFLAAATSEQQVTVAYDTTITTGCGTDPEVLYVSLNTP